MENTTKNTTTTNKSNNNDNHGGRLITATRSNTEERRISRTEITSKKMGIKTILGTFYANANGIFHEKTWP